MGVPPPLGAALDELPPDPRIAVHGGWAQGVGERWSLAFTARLSAAASEHMPVESEWHMVVHAHRGSFKIGIYPDARTGISATFAHQSVRRDNPDDNPWRLGKPCLSRPASVFQRDAWSGEPAGLADRIEWYFSRLLVWIDAAAEGRLIQAGDPFELPTQNFSLATSILGFREESRDYDWWREQDGNWGFAALGPVIGAPDAKAIVDFYDAEPRKLRSVSWSAAIGRKDLAVNGVWCALPAPPIVEPWQSPATWAELTHVAAMAGVDLPAIAAAAGARVRRLGWLDETRITHLLLRFPIAENEGEPPCRMHWLAACGLRLSGRIKIPRGEDFAAARQAKDREAIAAERPLVWLPTANWASDQLRQRGGAESRSLSSSMLVIGCGALGSAVAENLLRMGVTRLGLVDQETLAVGNLTRHLLTMRDVGRNKAMAMAAQLNAALPDADVRAFPISFPPRAAADRQAICGYDVIIDCTASDEVLDDMAGLPWPDEKIFVSLAMTWAAQGLVAFAASETAFPAIDARLFFVEASPRPPEGHDLRMEGLGCWHPVFPATADDVQLWAAIGTKFVRRAVAEPMRRRALFRRHANGAIESHDY